ncbi:MAG: hypothetical protein FWF69_03280 [Firmicutes bacterium]|nr:hypothetical protein [Bacillota bacterium]
MIPFSVGLAGRLRLFVIFPATLTAKRYEIMKIKLEIVFAPNGSDSGCLERM